MQVKLKTTIVQDDEKQQFDFDEPGQLVQLQDIYYLRYQEGTKKIPVTFKFDTDGDIYLTRNATNRTRFQFSPNQTFETHYQSEYGLIKLAVKTLKILQEVDFKAGQGKIAIDYQLLSQNQLLGMYQIRLQFNA
ncbi:DUF1934 domain-containing protein [Paucilactobacillus hokkaidonensis]|uniref:DUF1934 domain-containing protein n=1 Tax=Paucilactobacillus hokkaidonensis TaxID=1193095 RepID=UPI0020924397|nr:DUF1934 domain-containing protein [Paucilactobacillus hokkaidonensis]